MKKIFTLYLVILAGGNYALAQKSAGFKQGDKSTLQTTVYERRTGALYPVIYTNLMVPSADTFALVDGVAAAFCNDFAAAVDGDDAAKMWNPNENIALVRNASTLAIELRPKPKEDDTLFYRMYLRQQPYSLKIFSQNMPETIKGTTWLVDTYLGSKTEIDLSQTTMYNFTPNRDTNSYRNRFMLVFNHTEKKDIIADKNSVANSKASVNIYPNPVMQHNFNVKMSGLPAGSYALAMVNANGKMVMQKTINYKGNTSVEKIMLPSNVTAGAYIISVSGNGKILHAEQIITGN